jgi:hypothetical protein
MKEHQAAINTPRKPQGVASATMATEPAPDKQGSGRREKKKKIKRERLARSAGAGK